MARTKYTFEKRQREIAQKKKQKDKAARRAEAKHLNTDMEPGIQSADPGISGMADDHQPSAMHDDAGHEDEGVP